MRLGVGGARRAQIKQCGREREGRKSTPGLLRDVASCPCTLRAWLLPSVTLPAQQDPLLSLGERCQLPCRRSVTLRGTLLPRRDKASRTDVGEVGQHRSMQG